MSAPFDLGQDPVKESGRRVRQVGEILVFQGEEVGGQRLEVSGVEEQAGDDQDGLVVRLRRIGEPSEVPRLVDEADSHPDPESGYGHQLVVAIGSAARNGVGNSELL